LRHGEDSYAEQKRERGIHEDFRHRVFPLSGLAEILPAWTPAAIGKDAHFP
jgi:hypothetical protein